MYRPLLLEECCQTTGTANGNMLKPESLQNYIRWSLHQASGCWGVPLTWQPRLTTNSCRHSMLKPPVTLQYTYTAVAGRILPTSASKSIKLRRIVNIENGVLILNIVQDPVNFLGLTSRFAGWCIMKHTVAFKACTIFCFVFLLASLMFFGFNTNHISLFKAGNKSKDTSPPHDKELSTTLDPNKLYFQWGNPVWSDNTSSKHLVPRLQNVKRNFIKRNIYKVTFPNTTKRRKHSAIELLCMLKNVTMEMVKMTDFPISDSNWTSFLPLNALSDVAGNLKQCAVVSSSGAMKSSRLGSEIDAHDAVLRFNAAPTEGFEDDVGNKTTIRLINSQVVTLRQFNFMNTSFYQSGSLIMWDPAPYYAPLYKWSKNPEFKFKANYQAYRIKNPTQPFYILNPNVLWQLWDILQANTFEDIQPNPPSSGLTGIVLMMSLCDEVDVYEYLPSRRKTDLCHYFEKSKNKACMWGSYHPIIFEKNLIKQLNLGTDDNIYLYGKVTLPGFSKVQCKLR